MKPLSNKKIVLIYSLSPFLAGLGLGLFMVFDFLINDYDKKMSFFEVLNIIWLPVSFGLIAIIFFGIPAFICGMLAIALMRRMSNFIWLIVVSLFGGLISNVWFIFFSEEDMQGIIVFVSVCGFLTALIISGWIWYREWKINTIPVK